MTTKERQDKEKTEEIFTFRHNISIVNNEENEKRIAFTLPVDKERAKTILGTTNYRPLLGELYAKMEKLTEEDRMTVVAEFQKLIDLGYFMPIKSLPQQSQDEILNNGVVFYLSIAPSFKESLSTACRCNVIASKNTKLGS